MAIGRTRSSGVPGGNPVGLEDHDPVVIGADRDLVLGEDHPVGFDATELGLAERRPVGHHRAGLRDRDGLARGDVRRAAHDLLRRAAADVDQAHAEPVGVRMLVGLEHAADDEVIERGHAVVVDRLDLGPGHRQAVGERVCVERWVDVLAEPLERNAHQPNCSRKRTSLS